MSHQIGSEIHKPSKENSEDGITKEVFNAIIRVEGYLVDIAVHTKWVVRPVFMKSN